MTAHGIRRGRTMLLTWEYGPAGGLGQAMQWITRELEKAGIPITIASPFASQPLLSFTRFRGGHILFSLLLPFVLPFILYKENIDQVIVPVGPGGIFFLWWPSRYRVHAIVDHLYAEQCRVVPGEQWKKIFVPLERRMLRRAHSIVCVSPDTRDAVERSYDVSADVFIPFSFSAVPRVEKKSRLCACVARLLPRKGIPVLLDAWRAVHERFPDAALRLVGDGPDRWLLDDLPPDVRASIQWRPKLPYQAVLALFDRAEIFISTSYLEGFSLACAAAMNRGCMPVVSDVHGLRFFVDPDQNGCLVPCGDAHAFASAIIALLQDPDRLHVMGEAARDTILSHYGSLKAEDALRKTLIRHLTKEGS